MSKRQKLDNSEGTEDVENPGHIKSTSQYSRHGIWVCPGFTCTPRITLAYFVGKDPELCHECHNVNYTAVRSATYDKYFQQYPYEEGVGFDDAIITLFHQEISERMDVCN